VAVQPVTLILVSSRRARLFAGLALLVVAAAALGWFWRAGRARHPRVLLIGLDGADPAILERLIAAGKLPTFARLQRDGAFGPLRSREPLLSPVIWTSIATGRTPEDHGVLDFVEAAADGHAVPITSSRRRVPALWNIATQFGRASGFVGWYASFPVERVRGFEISDRIAFHQVANEPVAEGATFPPDLAATLQKRFGTPVPDLAAVRARFVSPTGTPLSADGERRLSQLARMYATTEYYRRIAVWLQRTYRPQLFGVYFEAIDACGHLFMEDAPPRRTQVTAQDYASFSETVDRCYVYQDEVLADLMTMADAGTLTLIVSDHGFKSGDRRPDTMGRADEGQAALWHLPNGVLLMHGGAVAHGSTVRGPTILDIAPTVLQALGLPLARDLPGHPIPQAFGASRLTAEPARVDRYDFVPVPPPRPGAADAPEKIAELHALGYLSGGADPKRPADEGRFAASFLNEGVALYVDGELADALRAFDRAMQLDPRNVNARAFAARVHIERREFDAAAPLLDQAVALDPRSAYVRLLRANLAISTQQWKAADAELAAAAALDRRLPMLYVQRARLDDAHGDPAAALDALATAETLTDADPMLLDILVLRADAATRAGRPAEAEAALGRAAHLASADQLAAARSEVALGRNDAAAAASYLRAALDRNPRSARLWSLLGATFGRQGDFSRAIDAYQRSVALEPTALACKTLAALLFEVRHDRAGAVALWERSLELDRNQPDVQRFLKVYGAR
jgi:predicted AlkP superfamily phosphohydrolase/phosphomutase/tetratricopeptide (TPR) repeat protein